MSAVDVYDSNKEQTYPSGHTKIRVLRGRLDVFMWFHEINGKQSRNWDCKNNGDHSPAQCVLYARTNKQKQSCECCATLQGQVLPGNLREGQIINVLTACSTG